MSKPVISKAFGREAFGLDPAGYHAARPAYPEWVGGWWVMVWNDFGDPDHPDPFHEATTVLLNGPSGPAIGDREIPFAQNKDARIRALEKTNAFDSIDHRSSAWSLVLDPDQVVRLYSTYSNINVRPDREAILAELGHIARDKFQGRVTRNMITTLYMARRANS